MMQRIGKASLGCAVCVIVACLSDAQAEPEAVEKTGIDLGVASVIDDFDRAIAIAKTGRLQVHLLAADPSSAEAWRHEVTKHRLGGRVVVEPLQPGRLPYPDRFINLLVGEITKLKLSPNQSADGEVQRVLAIRGAAWLKRGGSWSKVTRRADAEVDGWFSQWYDATGNCVSRDTAVGAPKSVQWQHGPAMEDRTADGKIVRVANGRLVHMDAATGEMYCRDAGNGSLLWKRFVGIRQQDEMVIAAGRIHIWHDTTAPRPKPANSKSISEKGPLVAIDLESGKIVQTYSDGLTAGTAPSERWLGILNAFEKPRQINRTPTPWFTVNERLVLQAYAAELVLLDRETGKRLWSRSLDDGSWFSPAVQGDVVVAVESHRPARRNRHDESNHAQAVVAFDATSGKQLWRLTKFHTEHNIEDKGRRYTDRAGLKPISIRGNRLLLQTASYQFRKGGGVSVHDLATGKQLWAHRFEPKERYTHGSYRAVLRDDEVVVMCGVKISRFDAETGRLRNEIKPPRHRSSRGNAACTASRATDSLLAANAYMYLDDDDLLEVNFGARGQCGQGVVPANGMIFACPTACDCGDYSRGYLGLAPSLAGRVLNDDERLESGKKLLEVRRGTPGSWSHFLGNAKRTSATRAKLTSNLQTQWAIVLAEIRDDAIVADRRLSERWLGAVSAPTVGEGVVVVSMPERHEVVALDETTGDVRWRQPTIGKVDSPPTLVRGLAVYGTGLGYVTARRAPDGELVWRFRASKTNGVSMHHGHIASPQPIPGSVLVLGETVIVGAGHHTDLAGLAVWSLDLMTGKPKAKRVLDASEYSVTANGIVSADESGDGFWLGAGVAGSSFHLSTDLASITDPKGTPGPVMRFDRDGDRIRFRTADGRGGSTHGWKQAMRSISTTAHRMAVDENGITYAANDPTSRERHPVNAAKSRAVIATKGLRRNRNVLWSVSQADIGNPESISAVIKAGNTLVFGGGSRNGESGFIQLIDAASGKLGQRIELSSRITECGLAARNGCLVVCTEHGGVHRFGD